VSGPGFSDREALLLSRYLTNLDRPVFALRNLPEVVKGALFSRYSRTEKSLRQVLLDEFIGQPDSGFTDLVQAEEMSFTDDMVAVRRAEEFYERVLVGYGDDSVAELAGAHIAVEQTSTLAAKAIEDNRIGISPLEKSTRYVRFDKRGPDERFLYYRGPELSHPSYEPAADELFATYSRLIDPITIAIRDRFPQEEGESDRAWKSATRAKALDLIRGLLPAGTLTNLGLYGNGRAFEYLITKLAANELPETHQLARDLKHELDQVIPAFVRRALDEKCGVPAVAHLRELRSAMVRIAPHGTAPREEPLVRLVDWDEKAIEKVVAAAVFPYSDQPIDLSVEDENAVLDALFTGRTNRRHRLPRALEHATYTFEIVANFGAYRDLQRHRLLTQDRQRLGTSLGYDVPAYLDQIGKTDPFRRAVESAAEAHRLLEVDLGGALAQYVVPLAFRLRWYIRTNLREIYHICELRTAPQGHPDYRSIAQEMFRQVRQKHPRLAGHDNFVDMRQGDELERRLAERKIDAKIDSLNNRLR
jgi:thymidylate synthase ThyX